MIMNIATDFDRRNICSGIGSMGVEFYIQQYFSYTVEVGFIGGISIHPRHLCLCIGKRV
jgi:hypothetical protein